MLGLELCSLSVTPYLACKDAARAIEFHEQAFGAAEVMRMPAPGGKLGHAEIPQDLSMAELRKRAAKALKDMGWSRPWENDRPHRRTPKGERHGQS